jgi:protease I
MARIAMLVGDDFEDVEFRKPYDMLTEAGHDLEVLGKEPGVVTGKRGRERARVEAAAGDRDVGDYDALVMPGGYGPDHLRTDANVVEFVRRFVDSGKPIAAVCHAPQLLIEADAVRGKTLTSWPSVKTDLENAGAKWIDREVVEDGALITSRKPDDLDAFVRALEARL